MSVVKQKVKYRVENENSIKKVAENLKNKSKKVGLKFKYKLGKVYEEQGYQFRDMYIEYTVHDFGYYQVIATLEIMKDVDNNNKNIVNIVNKDYSHKLKTYVRDFSSVCHHCNTNRKRRYIYLVWDEKKKQVLQLGKSCSKEYLGGVDHEALYKYLEDLSYIGTHDFQKKDSYSENIKYYNTMDVINYATKCLVHWKEDQESKGYSVLDGRYSSLSNESLETKVKKLVANRNIHNNLSDVLKVIDKTDNTELYSEYLKNASKNKDNVGSVGYNSHTFIDAGFIESKHLSELIRNIRSFYMNKLKRIEEDNYRKKAEEMSKFWKFKSVETMIFGMYLDLGLTYKKDGYSSTFNTFNRYMEELIEGKEPLSEELKLIMKLDENKLDKIVKFENMVLTTKGNDFIDKIKLMIKQDIVDKRGLPTLLFNIYKFLSDLEDKELAESLKDKNSNYLGNEGDSIKDRVVNIVSLKVSEVMNHYKGGYSLRFVLQAIDKEGNRIFLPLTDKESLLKDLGVINGDHKLIVDRNKDFKFSGKVNKLYDKEGKKYTLMSYVKLSENK